MSCAHSHPNIGKIRQRTIEHFQQQDHIKREVKTTTETILDIVRSEETIAGRSRWEIFSESLNGLTNHGEIYLNGSSPKEYYSLKFLNDQKKIIASWLGYCSRRS